MVTAAKNDKTENNYYEYVRKRTPDGTFVLFISPDITLCCCLGSKQQLTSVSHLPLY